MEVKDIGDQEVTGLEVFERDTGNKVDLFEYQDGDDNSESAHIYFVIIVKDSLPVPTPSASGSSADDGESYNAPSAGYDNSGNYSTPGAEYGNNDDSGFDNGIYIKEK